MLFIVESVNSKNQKLTNSLENLSLKYNSRKNGKRNYYF